MRLSGGYDPGHFVTDGSLRDVCAIDADIATWERLLAAAPGAHSEHHFRFEPNDVPIALEDFSVQDYFRHEHETSPTLAFRVGHIWFASYFFDPTEIEFTFGPEEVTNSKDFEPLATFMLWLAKVCARKVILTMEHNDSHRDAIPLIETLDEPDHPQPS